jgi:D-3-phosphoglycerate dehydrogenase / 2-oxoglutarate reductase
MSIQNQTDTNVLIIDDFHPELMNSLSELGLKYDYLPDINQKEVISIIPKYQGLILRSKIKCDKMFFENAPKLKWIARGGSGLDNIDEKEAELRDIKLLSAPEANCDAVAEHSIGLMLSLSKKIASSFQEVKQGLWKREENRGVELAGKTLGIIGIGHVGGSLANKMQGFGMKVLGYDKNKTNIKIPGLEIVSFETLKEEADWVSLHIPLNDENRELVNSDYISSFQKPFFLINTSRGQIVKTEDVLKAIKKGKIIGFGTDVLENEAPNTYSEKEKRIYSALFSSPNVVATPHVAGWSSESYIKISTVLANKIRNIFK